MTAPGVDSDGRPSWSYNQVEEDTADRVHALVPVIGRVRTGTDCPETVVYSSTNTGAATPEANAVPAPTRTTARLNALNGVSVGEGEDVETGVTVAEDVEGAVTDAVEEPEGVAERVAVLLSVGTADREGADVPVAELVTVDSGVPVMDGLAPNEMEAEPV